MNDMKQRVYEYIKKNGETTFPELEFFFNGLGHDWRGNTDITAGVYSNIIFWNGWNRETAAIVTELFNEKRITVSVADMIDILLGGKALPFPLAKQLMKYKTPHWLPVVLISK